MKKILSFVFLLLFLFNIFFYYPVFLILKHEIKSSLSEFNEKNKNPKDIVIFNISPKVAAKLEWKDKHEFRYNGLMYDVIKREVNGDYITYYCYIDHKEMKLFKGLSHFIKGISNQQHSEKKDSKYSLKEFYKDYFTRKKETVSPKSSQKFIFPKTTFKLCFFVLEKHTPPPKYIG